MSTTTIALFEEPYRISIPHPEAADGARIGLLLGMTDRGGVLYGVLLLEDGSTTYLPAGLFLIDFRYDVESDRWVDSNAPASDQEG